MNVLFLCTGNSCRSILGEATFNHLAPQGWRALSAGSKPVGTVHPRSLALLEREGIATAGYSGSLSHTAARRLSGSLSDTAARRLYSKSWNDLPVTPDIVLSVCGNAANETCPAYLGPAVRSHWGVEDPAHVTGSEEEIDAAFMAAYRILRHRIEQFFALPLHELQHDRSRLQAELDRIGTLLP
ncbi:MAG: arsenate reductase ArsC [Methylococcaceae bacterium]|nr:MAG: arsenate reductase ArsC [Methylococcaceae bacterium]